MSRVPPNDKMAERAVLGASLLNKDAFEESTLLVGPQDFYKTEHQIVFQAMIDLADAGEPVDIVTLVSWMQRNGHLTAKLDAAFVAELTNEVPSASHAKHYSEIVKKLAYRRHAINASHEFMDTAYTEEDITDAVAELDLALEAPNSPVVKTSRQLIAQRMEHYQKLFRGEISPGLKHDYHDMMDRVPLMATDYMVVAGRPGMGKTAFGLGLAEGVARAGGNVDYYSLEMTAEQLTDRRIAMESCVDSAKFRKGKFSESDQAHIYNAVRSMMDDNLRIIDKPAIGCPFIKAVSAKRKRKEGLQMIVIDHMHLMRQGNHNSFHAMVTDISNGIKAIAKDLDVAVVALAQLNRSVENQDIPKPEMHHLRESGTIEQDADSIIFIYRQDYYGERFAKLNQTKKDGKKVNYEEERLKGMGWFGISKSRHGPAGGSFLLKFKDHCAAYVSAEAYHG